MVRLGCDQNTHNTTRTRVSQVMAGRIVRKGSRSMGLWLDDFTKVTHGLRIVWGQPPRDQGRRVEGDAPVEASTADPSNTDSIKHALPPKPRRINVTQNAVEAGVLYDAYVQKRSEQFTPTERKVPATPLERVLGFSGVAAKLAFGTLGDYTKRALSGDGSDASAVMSASNAERLAAGLCRMRGAALKIGQMLSIQDNALVPPELTEMLQKVRQGADIMPSWQLEKMLCSEWGDDWRAKFSEFDMAPVAAASLGQVHRAVLLDGTEVAVKVQYPGVAQSIDSDIANLSLMIKVLGLAPKGLYIERVMEEGRLELQRECDYIQEAAFQERFRELVGDDPVLYVPAVFNSLTTDKILTTEFVRGIPIDQLVDFGVDQETRNHVATSMLELCLREVFEFRFMQTDPNWSNFLFDPKSGKVQLLDFGASREFSQSFVQTYLQMVMACASRCDFGSEEREWGSGEVIKKRERKVKIPFHIFHIQTHTQG